MYKRSEPDRRVIGNDRYEGYLADLTRLLSMIVGFEYELREVKDGKYGMKDPNGPWPWNGMIGEITRNVSNKKDHAYLSFLDATTVQIQ